MKKHRSKKSEQTQVDLRAVRGGGVGTSPVVPDPTKPVCEGVGTSP